MVASSLLRIADTSPYSAKSSSCRVSWPPRSQRGQTIHEMRATQQPRGTTAIMQRWTQAEEEDEAEDLK